MGLADDSTLRRPELHRYITVSSLAIGGFSKRAIHMASRLRLRLYRAFIAYDPVLSILLTAFFVVNSDGRKAESYISFCLTPPLEKDIYFQHHRISWVLDSCFVEPEAISNFVRSTHISYKHVIKS